MGGCAYSGRDSVFVVSLLSVSVVCEGAVDVPTSVAFDYLPIDCWGCCSKRKHQRS